MKRRMFEAVVGHRRAIVAAYVAVAAVCLVLRQFVAVNYDLASYLPSQAASTEALDTMADEFPGDIPNVRVMVPDVSLPQALACKERISEVDGVEEVLWLDDVASVDEPLEVQDASTVETYYRDGCALFDVTVDESRQVEAVDGIRAAAGEDAALTGSAVSSAMATVATEREIGLITAFAVAFILLVLVLTTESWAEPALVLAGLGISVFINWGTNLAFGEISFVTNSAGSILQVAIALDFSVFLLHRYAELRGSTGSVEGDMVAALEKSSVAIFSSGCTVTIGFLALVAMRYRIGADLGLALAKGIAISLLTVFTFTPSLLVLCDGLVRRTAHRRLIPGTRGFARLVVAVCVPVACALALLTVPARMASTSQDVSFWYGTSHIFGEGTQVGRDQERVREVFGDSDTYAVLVPRGSAPTEKALSEALRELPFVTSVTSYVDEAGATVPTGMAEPSTLELVESERYSRLVVSVAVPYEGEETFDAVEQVRAVADRFYPGRALVAGEGVSTADLRETITHDKDVVDLIAVGAVFAVLAAATRSASLPVILVLVIETSIWCNFSVPCITGAPVFFISYLIVSSIQLGVAVDYAILIADRYREDRVSLPRREALAETMEACAVPVLTSGTVLVVCGFLIYGLSSHGILVQLGYFLGLGTTMSLAAVLFALPGFLYLFDHVVARTTWRSRFLPDWGRRPPRPAPAYAPDPKKGDDVR